MEREFAEQSSAFPSTPGSVFPLYHVLADFGDYAGGEVIAACSNDPLRFDGVALKSGSRIAVILASWTSEPQRVRVTGMPAAAHVRRLTAAGAELALTQPECYRAGAEIELPVSGDGVEVQLEPFEVARLEFACRERK
jgi:hypothetical protein